MQCRPQYTRQGYSAGYIHETSHVTQCFLASLVFAIFLASLSDALAVTAPTTWRTALARTDSSPAVMSDVATAVVTRHVNLGGASTLNRRGAELNRNRVGTLRFLPMSPTISEVSVASPTVNLAGLLSDAGVAHLTLRGARANHPEAMEAQPSLDDSYNGRECTTNNASSFTFQNIVKSADTGLGATLIFALGVLVMCVIACVSVGSIALAFTIKMLFIDYM